MKTDINTTEDQKTESSHDSQPYEKFKYKVRQALLGAFGTLLVAVAPVVADDDDADTTSASEATDAISSVIETFTGLIVEIGAVLLFGYAAVLFIRMGISGFRSDGLKRTAITIGAAIALLMFEDVITPLIRGVAQTGSDEASTIVVDPSFINFATGVVGYFPI
jgi:hypothetical protein